jgi:hypothetical protein
MRYNTSTFNWKGILYKFELKYDKSDFVKSTNVDAKCTSADGGDVVSVWTGTLLRRPSRNFFEQADAEQELLELSTDFCDSNGIANRVDHPKLVGDRQAVRGGVFFHIYTLEVKPSHWHIDLGLRVLHEVSAFSFLLQTWTQFVFLWDRRAALCYNSQLVLNNSSSNMFFVVIDYKLRPILLQDVWYLARLAVVYPW